MPPAIEQVANDEDFQVAPLDQQRAYLSSIDGDFAKASVNDQNGYIAHVLAPSRAARAAQPTQFEKERQPQNQPGFLEEAGHTLYSQGKGLLEGAAHTLAGSPMLPPGQGEAPAPMALPESPVDAYKRERAQGRSKTYSAFAPTAANVTGVDLPEMEHQADIGNRSGVAAAGLVPAAEVGIPEIVRQVPPVNRAVTAGAKNLARTVRYPLETFAPRLAIPEAPTALRQAINPSVTIPRAGESIEIAGPRIQQLKRAGALVGQDGEPITQINSLSDLKNAIKPSKARVWEQFDKIAGPVKEFQATPEEVGGVAQAMRGTIDDVMREQYPAEAEAIEKRAATYDNRSLKLRQIEDRIESNNRRLVPLYKAADSGDLAAGSAANATKAETETLRDLLDSKVSQLRGPGMDKIKREYGALRDVEKATTRAELIDARQKKAPLYDALAALTAAGDLMNGSPFGAAKAAATLWAGRRLQMLRDPNFLTRQAFEGRKAFPAAEEFPEQGKFIHRPEPIEDLPTALPHADRPALGSGRVLQTEPPPGSLPPRALPPAPGLSREGLRNTPVSLSHQLPAIGETGATRTGGPTLETAPPARSVRRQLKPGRPIETRPVRMLPPAGRVNELQSTGGVITPGERLALAPGAVTPEHGIRTIGGRIVPREEELPAQLERAGERYESPARKTAMAEDRVKVAQLDRQIQDLGNQANKARSYNVRKQLAEKQKKLTGQRDEIRSRLGMGRGEQVGEAEDPLATYNTLSPEERENVDMWVKEIDRLPQSMRESEVEDLRSYGRWNVPMKERVARRLKAGKTAGGMPAKLEREPGEDDTAF